MPEKENQQRGHEVFLCLEWECVCEILDRVAGKVFFENATSGGGEGTSMRGAPR